MEVPRSSIDPSPLVSASGCVKVVFRSPFRFGQRNSRVLMKRYISVLVFSTRKPRNCHTSAERFWKACVPPRSGLVRFRGSFSRCIHNYSLVVTLLICLYQRDYVVEYCPVLCVSQCKFSEPRYPPNCPRPIEVCRQTVQVFRHNLCLNNIREILLLY